MFDQWAMQLATETSVRFNFLDIQSVKCYQNFSSSSARDCLFKEAILFQNWKQHPLDVTSWNEIYSNNASTQ